MKSSPTLQSSWPGCPIDIPQCVLLAGINRTSSFVARTEHQSLHEPMDNLLNFHQGDDTSKHSYVTWGCCLIKEMQIDKLYQIESID